MSLLKYLQDKTNTFNLTNKFLYLSLYLNFNFIVNFKIVILYFQMNVLTNSSMNLTLHYPITIKNA